MSCRSPYLQIQDHGAARAGEAHADVLESPKLGVSGHHLLRCAHLEPIDVLQTVAILEAERAKQRIGSDAEQSNADDVAILLLWDDACRLEKLEGIGEH